MVLPVALGRPGERGSHQSHCDGAPDSGGPPNLTLILTLTLTLKKVEKGKKRGKGGKKEKKGFLKIFRAPKCLLGPPMVPKGALGTSKRASNRLKEAHTSKGHQGPPTQRGPQTKP